MSIEIGANCEKCGGELNIYQEWDSTNVYVKPCEYCMGELSKDKDALQRKLDIAIKALNMMSLNGPYDAEDKYIPDEALKQLEGE